MPTEDEIYRASTQYRLWNFTPEKLADLRAKTNAIAKEHVRAAIKRKQKSSDTSSTGARRANGKDVGAHNKEFYDGAKGAKDESSGGSGTDGGGAEAGAEQEREIDYLTVEEEKILSDFFCLQLMNMASLETFQRFPTNVTATSIQFIKRFYLTNSVMSYHPLQIMTTALFLATKTENHYISLKDYASILSQVPGLEKVTGEDILAPEYILTQGLRFCFDVRHPHRALKGAYIELQLLLSLAKGDATPATWRLKGGEKEMQKRLLATYGTPAKFGQRIERTYGKARETLQGPAILSDAYFLYTPSQIMMAALWIADEGLLTDLVEFKFSMPPPNPSSSASESSELPSRPPVGKVLNEIKNCAKLLQSVRFDDTQLKKDATRVDRKLHFCRNPEMLDLVGLNQAQKRDASKDGLLDENLAKKRKLERERSLKEAEDVFGPSL